MKKIFIVLLVLFVGIVTACAADKEVEEFPRYYPQKIIEPAISCPLCGYNTWEGARTLLSTHQGGAIEDDVRHVWYLDRILFGFVNGADSPIIDGYSYIHIVDEYNMLLQRIKSSDDPEEFGELPKNRYH